jgi:hypothetical protein
MYVLSSVPYADWVRLWGRRRREGGAVAVELALLAPLLILLIFSVIAMGFAIGDWMAVNNAARAAARQGAVFGVQQGSTWSSSCQGIVEAARRSATGVTGGIPNRIRVTVRDAGSGAALGCDVAPGGAGGSTEANRPCLDSGTAGRSPDLRVDIEVTPYRLEVPFGININTRLAARGVFRCEFNQ